MILKKYDKRILRKIYNIIDAIGKNGLKEEENISYLISQASIIFEGEKNRKKLEEMTDKEKEKYKEKILKQINECIKQYGDYKKRREGREKIVISWEKREYISKYINISIYFYINNTINKEKPEKMVEEVLYMLFDGVCDAEILEDIKTEDPIYYELILEDVSTLIYKTLGEILKIKKINKRRGEAPLIDYKPSDTLSDIYTLFLENYNLTPEQINNNKAVDILKMLSEISKKQAVREAEEQAKGIDDPLMRDAFIAQTLRDIGEGD